MAIKRRSCRVTERTRMRKMHAEGFDNRQISNATSVVEDIVADVVSGRWAEAEAAQARDQVVADETRAGAAQKQKIEDAAAIATATALALQQAGVATIPSPEPELSPQQRSANTRRANAAAREVESEEDQTQTG